jgi:hypothetical protein
MEDFYNDLTPFMVVDNIQLYTTFTNITFIHRATNVNFLNFHHDIARVIHKQEEVE